MDKFYFLIPKNKPVFILILVLLLILILILLLIIFLKKPQESLTPPKISDLQKTIIGKTNSQEIEKNLIIKEKKELGEGKVEYNLETYINPVRPDQVIVKDGQVIFERINIPEQTNHPSYVKLSYFKERFGEVESIKKGSKTYGPLIETHIYSSKGVALIANPFTEEVYEIQLFKPSTAEKYIREFGEDINESGPIKEDLIRE
ncbi:hypothetical protein HYS91_01730 [Candidatus Daviesbacteria bacterium]|nr:hypothetical protein [Candidatus Daviesbacteria bacterium]